MSALVFPVHLFPPAMFGWSIDGAYLEGGQPIEGAPQTADISGGGFWRCRHDLAMLRTPLQVGVYRAILTRLSTGKRTIVMPAIDALRPFPAGLALGLEGFSDGTAFSDGTLFAGDLVNASLAAAAYMPAWPTVVDPDLAQIAVETEGVTLQGVEYFTIFGPSGDSRLHQLQEIEAVDGDVYTVRVSPPFRENMAPGTPVDFNNPRCKMKLDLQAVRDAWAVLGGGMVAKPSIRFLEGGFVVPTNG